LSLFGGAHSSQVRPEATTSAPGPTPPQAASFARGPQAGRRFNAPDSSSARTAPAR
jgi:hypothetical protein